MSSASYGVEGSSCLFAGLVIYFENLYFLHFMNMLKILNIYFLICIIFRKMGVVWYGIAESLSTNIPVEEYHGRI